ncbi:DUF4118 domain-containing protein [Streptomyces sp. SID13031]|uniref:sensor histidine kinase n=1 Tax=Streptomyces sp. SID13031 TaxID=2706046 RepID=UPI0013CA1278|nr:DUF4118 domain-containing protein [Streptomyces sp. SID13031]NEA30557.1 DUF4118 domain-containing protein [Streptomyces sp. SID13031]
MAWTRLNLPIARWLRGVLTSVALVAAVSGVIALLEPALPPLSLLVLYLFAVMPVAVGWGARLAALTSLISVCVFAVLFLRTAGSFRIAEARDAVALGVFLVTAAVVAELAARSRRAAVEAERLTMEQSGLRRVATLVAESVESPAVFKAVTREVGLLCGADLARMERYEVDGTVSAVAAWSSGPAQLAVDTRFDLEGLSVARDVRRTGGPVRLDSFAGATGGIADEARALGIRSSIGCPIVVDGKLWGVIAASTKRDAPFAANTEAQIAAFTELVATAIANAEAHTKLNRSRARIVATADETRRRIERDLHDGAQQRLVSLALEVRLIQDGVPGHLPMIRDDLERLSEGLTEVVDELREMARGIHPSILSRGGLGAALRMLARRSAVPVELSIGTASRYSPPVEAAAYYVVSEALTNVAKHADASQAEVTLGEHDGRLRLRVRDDGLGGAEPRRGSGLIGLRDRVEALGGSIDFVSHIGYGTVIEVALPLDRTDQPAANGSP